MSRCRSTIRWNMTTNWWFYVIGMIKKGQERNKLEKNQWKVKMVMNDFMKWEEEEISKETTWNETNFWLTYFFTTTIGSWTSNDKDNNHLPCVKLWPGNYWGPREWFFDENWKAFFFAPRLRITVVMFLNVQHTFFKNQNLHPDTLETPPWKVARALCREKKRLNIESNLKDVKNTNTVI